MKIEEYIKKLEAKHGSLRQVALNAGISHSTLLYFKTGKHRTLSVLDILLQTNDEDKGNLSPIALDLIADVICWQMQHEGLERHISAFKQRFGSN